MVGDSERIQGAGHRPRDRAGIRAWVEKSGFFAAFPAGERRVIQKSGFFLSN